MSKKPSNIPDIFALSHDKDDGFTFLCSLEQKENYHGDKNLQKSCQELLVTLRRKR